MELKLATPSLIASFPLKEWQAFWNSFVEERAYINTQGLLREREAVQWVEKWLKRVEEGQGWVAMAWEGERVIGVATVKRRPFPTTAVGDFGIAVRKGWRGQGIGWQLSTLALGKALEELRHVFLKVVVDNKEAVELYKALGFQEVLRVEKAFEWYGEEKDYLLMHITRESRRF